MFELDRFKADCSAAVGETAAVQAIREIVARAVADPSAVQKAITEPYRAEVQILHRSADLTILNVVWGPRMTVMPHNHEMWAVIGIYSGREDNILWRRLPGEARTRIEAAGAKALSERDAFLLGHDIIHSVTNPIGRLTGAIHVRHQPPSRQGPRLDDPAVTAAAGGPGHRVSACPTNAANSSDPPSSARLPPSRPLPRCACGGSGSWFSFSPFSCRPPRRRSRLGRSGGSDSLTSASIMSLRHSTDCARG